MTDYAFRPPAAWRIANAGLALVVPRGCGSTFAARVAWQHQKGSWVREADEAHFLVGESRDVCLLPGETDAEPARVIGVWHDPLQRFTHLVRMFQAKPTRYHWLMGLGYDSPPEAYLELARWELDKPRLADQEEGFRRQCDMFAAVGVELVITLPELVPLLRAHGVRWRRFARPGALRACEPLPPGVIEHVRELYAADLTIPARSLSGA